ncbi:MAG: Type 1 glutamine amidotransferase-like domain-containing protein [Patescibacteria group bacterium]
MKFYLSSYKLGNETEKLKKLIPQKKIGFIPNALDFSTADPIRKKKSIEMDIASLRELGLDVTIVDLKNYFNRHNDLKIKLDELGAIFICGGNVFVLRQAMKLSGLDQLLKEYIDNENFLYSGYSAAGCVLSANLKVYEIVDDATDTPYDELKEVIWDGLGFINFAFMPHWDSNHPESAAINKEIEFCRQNNIPYKAIRDGEVIMIV